jgi:predicted DNA-binding transcriptional regulator AlpA
MITERTPEPADDIELIRKKPLCRRLGFSEWTLQRKVKAGEFPRPI